MGEAPVGLCPQAARLATACSATASAQISRRVYACPVTTLQFLVSKTMRCVQAVKAQLPQDDYTQYRSAVKQDALVNDTVPPRKMYS
jgi:hypothetical protein